LLNTLLEGLMRRALMALCAVVVVGCTTDSDPGFADVMGHVMLASGLPLTSALVTVSCGGAPELVPGDSLGRYQVSLESTVGTHQCSFLAVNPGTPGFQVDAAVSFAPAGLHALQTVDLRAPATP
jgi:hypothetical protein